MVKLKKIEKVKFIRIIIGMAETGYSGIKKPMKTISVDEINVNKIYEIIKGALKNG